MKKGHLQAVYHKLGETTANDASEYDAIIAALQKALKETPNDMVDYLDEIDMWEPLEYSFTVEAYCKYIGLAETN